MEVVIVLFLGVWLSATSALAYIGLKREYKEFFKENKQ